MFNVATGIIMVPVFIVFGLALVGTCYLVNRAFYYANSL